MKKQHVLIVGAGPVGLCMAAGLAHHGIASTVIEKEPTFAMFPKASTIHPPTLGIFEEWGLLDKLLAEGLKARYLQYWDRHTSQMVAEFDLDVIKAHTPYPYRLQLEQSALQVILQEEFEQSNLVDILFEHELLEFEQTEDKVIATLQTPEETVTIETDFLIGSDGATSTVRKKMLKEYAGFTYPQKFLVLGIVEHDFSEQYPGLKDVSYFFDDKEWIAVIRNNLMWKLTCPLAADLGEKGLEINNISRILNGFTGIEKEYNIVHKSIYKAHQRVVPKVFDGRVILIGDAAHINNPLGGMGMNSGIHDAYFLAKDIEKVMSNPLIPVEETLERYSENRHRSIKEVQRRTIENEKLASKSSESMSQLQRMKTFSSDKNLAIEYLLESSMINDFNYMASRNVT